MTLGHDSCGVVGFEASHWSESGFESAVVGLDAVVGVLVGVVERVRGQFFDHGREWLGEIGDDLIGLAARISRRL